MLGYNRISDSHECKVCHCWYFFKIIFAYQSLVCNGCNDLLQKSMSFNDVEIVTVGRNYYKTHFWDMAIY